LQMAMEVKVMVLVVVVMEVLDLVMDRHSSSPNSSYHHHCRSLCLPNHSYKCMNHAQSSVLAKATTPGISQ